MEQIMTKHIPKYYSLVVHARSKLQFFGNAENAESLQMKIE